LTALAYPPAGELGHLLAGPVDAAPPALLGGLIAGAGLGLAQWAALRRRGIRPAAWISRTALGLAVGTAAGAAVVSYRTDRMSLVTMGAIAGLVLGVAQGSTARSAKVGAAWALSTSLLSAIAWAISAGIGVDVEAQYIIFGISGAALHAAAQSTLVRDFTATAVRGVS
jgi:hypothetical protein